MQDLEERGFGETGDYAICLSCIVDEGLRKQVAGAVTEEACSFCGTESTDAPVAVPFDDFMRSVMPAIRFFYERSVDSLYWEDDFTPRLSSEYVAIAVCSGCVSDDALGAIVEVISDDEWNEDPAVLSPDVALSHAWNALREKVKHESRFVFLTAREESSTHPDDITARELLDRLAEIVSSSGALVDIPVGRVFWRGRMVDDPDNLEYDAKKLGSPPPNRASANRMSPAGISMFYGCDDVETVVAEIGAHSVKRHAVVGRFETTRPLVLVDLANLPSLPSYFDPETRDGYFDMSFLWSFARDLSAPVELDGSEHIDYVPTQVVTEYLRWLPELGIDGITFRSGQNGGTSSVIFCGPPGCADPGNETDDTMLRLDSESVHAVRVVATPGDLPPAA